MVGGVGPAGTVNDIEFASADDSDLWAQLRKRGGFTPDFQDYLIRLAKGDRLGPFCLWPNPPGINPERNVMWMERAPGPPPQPAERTVAGVLSDPPPRRVLEQAKAVYDRRRAR